MAVPLSLAKTCLGCYDECEIRTATVTPLEAFEMLSRYCTFKRRCQRLLPAAPSEVEPQPRPNVPESNPISKSGQTKSQ